MSEQDVISCLKTLQGLLERSVNGNHQTHTLLEQLNKNMERMVVCNEHTAELMQKSWEAYAALPRK